MEAGDTTGTGSGEAPSAKRAEKPLPPAAKRKQKRVGGAPASKPGASDGAPRRYTAPIPASKRGPSPRWVPVLMFGLWGLGLAMILLNYMEVLPGSADGGNGLYLVGGLAAILAGIVAATQYR